MNKTPLISIVIPVYNVEKYLEKCLNSVLSQNFSDYEIILVNDGSTDTSLEICKSFTNSDNRIILIDKENGGLSDARNQGILESKGKYVMFLDSDDYWREFDALDKLVIKMKINSDIILYKYQEFFVEYEKLISKKGKEYNIDNLNQNKNIIINKLFEDSNFPGSAWSIAIKKDFIIDNNLFFTKGIKSEDIDWIINVFIHLKSISAVDDDFYIYLKNRPGSITNTADYKSFQNLFYSIDKWRTILEDINEPFSQTLLSFLAYEYIITVMMYSKLLKENKPRAKVSLKRQKSILRYTKGRNNIICMLLIKYLGFQFSSILITKLYRFSKKNNL